MSLKTVTLSRHQIERLAIFLTLNTNVNSVTVQETSVSGIGAHHWAVYHTDQIEREFQDDITDVGTW